VTKWRAADAALKASDELLRTITDNIPGAVFQLCIGAGGARSVPFVSRGVELLLERTATEMHSAIASGDILVVPEDRQAFWESLDRSLRTLTAWDADFRICSAQTHVLKWIRLRAVPSRLPDGATLWNGVMTDVSDQVAAAEALRESEARYRLLTENTTDLIARLSPMGVFRYVSAASQALLGRAPEEFVGRHLKEIVHEDDEPLVARLFERLYAGQPAQPFAHRTRARDGTYVWCESTARAVHDKYGSVAEVVTVTRSIEERRKLEAKVQQSQKLQRLQRNGPSRPGHARSDAHWLASR
jgi:PAS domain S-box-containing protein